MSFELIKLIMAYTLVGVFIFTAVVTSLSLVGWVKFADNKQQQALFKALIIEVVAVAVGFLANVLEFNPVKAENKIAQSFFENKKEKFVTELSNARKAYEANDFQKAYLMANKLFNSEDLSEFLPIRDLFILNGDIATKREFWSEALESYGPALKLDPNNISLMVSAGYAQRQLQNYEAAELLYERALVTQSQNWEVLNGYYNCLRRYAAFLADEYPKISNIKFQRASEIVKEMRNVASDQKQKRMSDIAKGTLYWEWKQYDVARATYQQLTSEYPTERRFQEDLAAILMEMGKYNEAEQLYSGLYKREKDVKKIRWYVGSGYAEAASKATTDKIELQAALDAGLIAISNKPDEPFSYYAVGMVYKRLGNNVEAISNLKKAEALEANRDTNMHTYDKKRHMMYRAILREWGVKT